MNVVRLGEVAKVRNGFAFDSSDFMLTGVPVIRMSDIQDGEINVSNAMRVDEMVLEQLAQFKVCKDDILIGMSGSIGKVAVYKSNVPSLQNQRVGVFVITDPKRLEKGYLKYFSFTLEEKLLSLGRGVAVQNISASEIEDVELPLPPLENQHRIAAILEAADHERRRRRAVMELSDKFLQDVFVQMFGNCSKNVDLGSVAEITGGGTPSRDISRYYTGQIPWVTAKDMSGVFIRDSEEHVTEEAIANSAAKLLPAGVILVVVKSKALMHRLPVGISTVALCHNQDIKAIHPPHEINQYFLFHAIKYNAARLLYLARGANTEGLTLDMVRATQVPEAPKELRDKFGEIFEQHEYVRRQQQESARQGEHLFQTLLHRAFNGEL